jgi:hypothetical protein
VPPQPVSGFSFSNAEQYKPPEALGQTSPSTPIRPGDTPLPPGALPVPVPSNVPSAAETFRQQPSEAAKSEKGIDKGTFYDPKKMEEAKARGEELGKPPTSDDKKGGGEGDGGEPRGGGRNNPETAPPSPGSGGQGSYGRCYV